MENDAATDRQKEIGQRIVQARKELGGMRQEELADLLHVSVRSMQAYESGEVVPYRKLKDIEKILGRPMAWFLHGDESEPGRDAQLEEIRDSIAAVGTQNRQRDELLGELLAVSKEILAALSQRDA